jgi:hypothetical protein
MCGLVQETIEKTDSHGKLLPEMVIPLKKLGNSLPQDQLSPSSLNMCNKG